MPNTTPTILIVGGVAGGASAATRARRMNEKARIVIFEKDEHVSFANCGLPYYLGREIEDRDALLVATPELFRRRFNIEVRTFAEVTAIDRPRKQIVVRNVKTGEETRESYDKLILAPGAAPMRPPLPGMDAPNVLTLRNLADTDAIDAILTDQPTGHVTVVGAGYIGLEMAEQMIRRGWAVSLVEKQPQVLPLLDADMAFMLAEQVIKHGVDLHLAAGLKALHVGDDQRVEAVELDDGTRLETQLVIVGIGVRPNVALAKDVGLPLGTTGGITIDEFARTADPDIYAVGDAVEYHYAPLDKHMRVALAGPANRAGRLAGEHAATGYSRPLTPVQGTSIVRVFDLAAGMTGLSFAQARRAGLDARQVVVTANHHAGYFPGAQKLVLKVVYAAGDGRVLGAQAVGPEGIDKRLDVLATALHFHATVDDLAGLDLAYAPPFGSAKDPIHMAAFTAINDLTGVAPLMMPDADLSEYQVVDVRSAAEVQKLPLAGVSNSVRIPVDQLRDRLGELDPSRPTVASCATAMRSHVAVRILKQHGFAQVWNLTGAAEHRRRAVTPAATLSPGTPGTPGIPATAGK